MLKQIISLTLLLLSQPLSAQNLIDIYKLAVTQDAQLKVAESQYRSTLETLPLALATQRPHINLSANVTNRESDSSMITSSHGFGITLLQNVYNAGNIAAVDIAEARIAKMRAELEMSRQNLMLRVAEHYFRILAAKDNVEFAIAEKNAINKQLEQAQKRFEVGLIAITDVHEAQAQFDNAVAQQILAKNLLENAYQALQVITNQLSSRKLARLGEQFELSIPSPADNTQWIKLALQNNHNLIAALAELNIAQHTRQQQIHNNYPAIDLKAGYINNVYRDYNQEDVTISLELNVPLYAGGQLKAEKRQTESDYQAARHTVILQRRLTSQQTQNAYLSVVSGISQVEALHQSLDSSTTAFNATKAGFEAGTRTSVEVLVSLRATYGAQRDYANARYDYLLNILHLKQAAGLLNINDLIQINKWLNP